MIITMTTTLQTIVYYLRQLMSGSPIDNVTNAMSRKKSHYNMAKPYMIFNTSF